MIRDMKSNKLEYVACIFIITVGLMTFSGMSIVMEDMLEAKESFYSNYHFADVFSEVVSYPSSKISDLYKIEGIKEVDGRLKQDVMVNQGKVESDDANKEKTIRLISYDTEDDYILNGADLSYGYNLSKNSREIWLDKKYFETNGYNLGDKIELIINGSIVEFSIAGAVESVEFVYAMKSQYDIYPNPETFGIGYIEKGQMEKLLGEIASVNDISFELKDGYEFEDVDSIIESRLDSYGLKFLMDGEDQSSNFMVTQELMGLSSMATGMPILFLSISSFMLYIMLKRIVEQQRGQIGTLKAMGYSSNQVLIHFIGYAVVIGLIGGILGGASGTWLSGIFADLYSQFFSFPGSEIEYSFKYFFIGILISVGFSVFAGYYGAKESLKLTPAEAMSPPTPEIGKNTSFEKLDFFWKRLTIQGKMAMRNIARSKGRSGFTFIGVVFTFAMLVSSWSFEALVDTMIFDQFKYVQLYDMKTSFVTPIDADAGINSMYNIDGVTKVESIMEIPITLKNENDEKSTVLLGIENDSSLYKVIDENKKEVKLDEDGLYLSKSLATKLKLKKGDFIRVESPFFEDEYILMEVVDIIAQYLGSNGYANIDYLEEVSGLNNMTMGLIANIETGKENYVKSKLEDSSIIGSVEFKEKLKVKYYDLLGSYSYMYTSMAVMSMLVGFAIVYNSSAISLSERERELASMRVLGMSPEEVLEIVSFEQWFLGIGGIIVGLPLGIGMMKSLSFFYQTDMFTMPATISPNAFFLSILSTFLFIWISQRSVMNRIKKLDIVEVLKARE